MTEASERPEQPPSPAGAAAAARPARPPRPLIDLDGIAEEQLLDQRICDLPIAISGTWLEPRVAELHAELKQRDILFAPRCYLADEWLTPEGEPVIGIPFYLAHPRLIALEKKMMLDAEGDTEEWCMQLLRHEAGHALSYAFDLHRKRSWQRVFGSSSAHYGDTYRFRPYSKAFVRHLDHYYAQYHPDEDFVETFAVWLTPGLDWRHEYQGWKALDKLLYVDKLMQGIAGKPPRKDSGSEYWKASRIRRTLRSHYQKRRHDEAENYPDFHDNNLLRMFVRGQAEGEARPAVTRLIQAHRKALLKEVSGWTGESRYMVDRVIKAIHTRARALRLVIADSEAAALLQLSTYLTTLLMNYRHTNRLRGKP